LPYPTNAGEEPACGGKTVMLAGHKSREGKPGSISFGSRQCGRSERFICEQ